MTKKDYELIAKAILGTRYSADGLNGLAYLLAAEFESANPRFDRNKFLQACGIETEPLSVKVSNLKTKVANLKQDMGL